MGRKTLQTKPRRARHPSERYADINFDCTVDAADMGFVRKNYLMKNQTASNASKAKENYKGKTLDRILDLLGIQ
jgi:hypothetical protein